MDSKLSKTFFTFYLSKTDAEFILTTFTKLRVPNCITANDVTFSNSTGLRERLFSANSGLAREHLTKPVDLSMRFVLRFAKVANSVGVYPLFER